MSETEDLFGGDIIILNRIFLKLAAKHMHDMPTNTGANNFEFTENILDVANVLLDSRIAWLEMNNSTMRHMCASDLLVSIDHISYLYLVSLPPLDDTTKSFNFSNIHTLLANVPKTAVGVPCFSFQSGSICVPDEILSLVQPDIVPCIATEVNVRNLRMGASDVQTSKEDQVTLIGLSLANGTEISIPRTGSPVVIDFKHEESNHFESKSSCVFWDLKISSWSRRECFLIEDQSSMTNTLCQCFHLTNFGILMDYTSNADPFDEH